MAEYFVNSFCTIVTSTEFQVTDTEACKRPHFVQEGAEYMGLKVFAVPHTGR